MRVLFCPGEDEQQEVHQVNGSADDANCFDLEIKLVCEIQGKNHAEHSERREVGLERRQRGEENCCVETNAVNAIWDAEDFALCAANALHARHPVTQVADGFVLGVAFQFPMQIQSVKRERQTQSGENLDGKHEEM